MPTSELVDYFTAEKQGAVVIGGVGIVSVLFAAYLWLTGSVFRAMAWPLIVIGAGQLAIGVGLWIRTDPQVTRLQEGLRSSPQVTVDSELTRMARVNRSFKIVVAVEILLIGVGLFLALILRSRHLAWASVGMGLLLQAAVTLVFDLFAEHRAAVYTRWLVDFCLRAPAVDARRVRSGRGAAAPGGALR
jgi:hypothetical protein